MEGVFNEDWRQMNRLNFVFVPKTMESREQLDNLYNWHVKRFYMDQGWRNRFAGRLWQHRWSLFHFFRHRFWRRAATSSRRLSFPRRA